MEWEYLNFKKEEFACRHCGKDGISSLLLDKLQSMRTDLGFPFVISSGYRCEDHEIEKQKRLNGKPMGAHNEGLAVDILCNSAEAYTILSNASNYGFTGIGVNQKGNYNLRYIHLDILENKTNKPRPHIWSY